MLHRMVRRRPWVCGLTEPATCLRLQPEGSSGTASAKFPSCRGCRHPKSHTFSTGADTALSIVRTQSGNRKLSEILNEAEKAWQDSQYPSKITFQLLHLHDELEDQDTDGAIQATAPTLIATAERNQLLDTDLMTTERGNPARERRALMEAPEHRNMHQRRPSPRPGGCPLSMPRRLIPSTPTQRSTRCRK